MCFQYAATNVCNNHGFCYTGMPKENSKILKYNHGEKSMKIPSITNSDMECLLERIGTCHINPKKSSTAKITKHLVSGYSLFTHCSFS